MTFIVGSRLLLLTVLVAIHLYWIKNFDLQFNEDNNALTTSLMSKSNCR